MATESTLPLINLTITTSFSEDVFFFEIDAQKTVLDLKSLLEPQSGIPVATQELFLQGKKCPNTSTLAALGLQGESQLLLRKLKAKAGGVGPATQAQQGTRAGGGNVATSQPNANATQPDPATLMEVIRADPETMEQLRHGNPELLQAALDNDLERFKKLLEANSAARTQQEEAERREREYQHLLASADPFDPVAQAKIAEYIRQKNVEENYVQAMDHNPEAFARVTMLYIDCVVNGVKMKAFVDSGAQSTIMSEKCARTCNIYHLIDTRFSGMAAGVGTAPILGRVHVADLKIGNSFFNSSFTIMKSQPGGQELDFLLGLDNLKRHQACIDLKENVLRIGGEVVPFLPESEIPAGIGSENPLRQSVDGLGLGSEVVNNSPVPASNSNASNNNNNSSNNTAPPSSSNSNNRIAFPSEVIEAVQSLTGRSTQDVIAALEACGGNADLAVQHLMF